MAKSMRVLAAVVVAGIACSRCAAFTPSQFPMVLTKASSKLNGRCGSFRVTRRGVSISSTATAPRMDAQSKITMAEEFWTRPRTTNANWGVFFEVVAKDRPIWVTGLRAGGHSFASHDDYTRMKIRVLTADGSAVGKELNEKAWTVLGEAENFNLPRVEVGDVRAVYTSLPFKPVQIPANSARAFCIHTDKKNGLALRRKLNFDSNNLEDPYFRDWNDGVTDENDDLKLIAGLVPGEKLFKEVSSANNARAFVGVVQYQLTDPSK